MIEFKAECGHTVRAKDEDAGKVVRCSYCGRETQVPDQNGEEDLNFLFSEVEKTGVYEAQSDRERRKRMKKKAGIAGPAPSVEKSSGGGDAFSVVLKLCYATVIICVMIFVGKKVYHYVQSPPQSPSHSTHGSGAVKTPAIPKRPDPSSTEMGLVDPVPPKNKEGIFVSSVPDNADVYVVDPKKVTVKGSFLRAMQEAKGECHRKRSGQVIDRESGNYDVYVALRLTDSRFWSLPGYRELRNALREKKDVNALKRYFSPDGSSEVFTDALPDGPTMIVRKYSCEIIEGRWSSITALFVPDLALKELLDFSPPQKRYRFNKEGVRAELDYQGVRREEWPVVLSILERTGALPYRTEDTDRECLLFTIDAMDGSLVSRRLKTR